MGNSKSKKGKYSETNGTKLVNSLTVYEKHVTDVLESLRKIRSQLEEKIVMGKVLELQKTIAALKLLKTQGKNIAKEAITKSEFTSWVERWRKGYDYRSCHTFDASDGDEADDTHTPIVSELLESEPGKSWEESDIKGMFTILGEALWIGGMSDSNIDDVWVLHLIERAKNKLDAKAIGLYDLLKKYASELEVVKITRYAPGFLKIINKAVPKVTKDPDQDRRRLVEMPPSHEPLVPEAGFLPSTSSAVSVGVIATAGLCLAFVARRFYNRFTAKRRDSFGFEPDSRRASLNAAERMV